MSHDTCQWFSRCTRPAVTTRRGPVVRTVLQGGGLGFDEIPVCAQCAARIDGPGTTPAGSPPH